MGVSPVVEGGRYPAKATVGRAVPGQRHCLPGGPRRPQRRRRAHRPRRRAPSVGPHAAGRRPSPTSGTPRSTPDEVGRGRFEIEGWSDPIATWRHDAGIKIPAGIDVELMFAEGVLLLERLADGAAEAAPTSAARSTRPSRPSRDRQRPETVRYSAAVSPAVDDVLSPRTRCATWSPPRGRSRSSPTVSARSTAPGTSSSRAPRAPTSTRRPARSSPAPCAPPPSASTPWPRWASTSSTCRRSTPSAGSTARAATTPSTPVPTTPARRGRSGPTEGGHDAIHPDLGTMEDFDAFVARARELGLEVALDLALQAAPDHPWVKEHPEWFTTRADGTIAYAENPPKKYQDIYPLNFDNDPKGLYAEVPADPAAVDVARRADLPRRQPAHQAGRLLGVAARRGPGQRPRRDLPGRGVHEAGR